MQMSRHMPAPSPLARRMRRGLNAALLCAVGSCALPGFAGAQQARTIPLLGKLFLKQDVPVAPAADELRVSIEAKGATLGTVVDLLMDQAHASYTLDSRLAALPAGNVKLRKVSFSTALEIILKMSHGKATYIRENGIYRVVERETADAESADNAPKTTKQTPKEDSPASAVMPDGTIRMSTGTESSFNIQADNASLGSVLKMLARHAKVSITIDPSLLNVPLTASLRNVPFRVALDTVLKASVRPATYRVENGVYNIIPKSEEAPEGGAQGDVTMAATLINLDADKTDLYSTLKLLFAQVKVNYTLDPALRSIPVTVHIHQVPFGMALEMLLKGTSKPLTYRVENGMWSIVPKM